MTPSTRREQAGILNVCAAGNNAVNTDAAPFDPASFASSSIVSVAASDQFDNKAAFSNYGVTSVDLAAPGVDILSTAKDGGYDYGSGTSMAAPHVAGAAALLASLDPTLSVDALKVTLMQNVDVVPAWSGVVASGGRLNVHRAATAVVPTVGLTSAVFAGFDTTTQGDWTNGYGGAGYSIVSDVTSLPPYASVTPSGHQSWTWAASTSDGRALTRAVAPGRVAATWYQRRAVRHHRRPHRRSAASGRVLLRRLRQPRSHVSAWTCSMRRPMPCSTRGPSVVSPAAPTSPGRSPAAIRVRVTRVGGMNAVVSGVFIGPSLSGNQPPTVSITSPSAGAMFALGSVIPLAATAGDPDGTVASVAFYANGQLLHTDTSAPYAFDWANAPAGTHTLTAVATDDESQPATSAPITISVAAPGGASAVFAGFDPTTQGDWTNGYGGAGYSIVSDVTSLPPYASVTPSGHESWTWAASTSDGRALTRAAAPGRVAATWHSGAPFDITVGLTDGQPHLVAFYCVDYDSLGRSQRLDVFDAATNALLDTRTISSFSGGTYVAWTITGSVRVRVTRVGGMNAVVSGVFIDDGVPANQPPQ